mmetsp:Transcript_24358/g.79589  ORF Transcript_24358/g.79589 Transcript_24358/m.79589 type:complete len:485 (-) Transcript_24358:996-2450(-)
MNGRRLLTSRASVRLPEHSVEDEEVDVANYYGDDHHGESDSEEIHEGDMVSLSLCLGCHNDVCRSPNQRPVASEACSKRQRPRKGLDADPRNSLNHLHHDGDHGGSEGNVVDEGREDRRGPADEEEGEVLPPLHRHRRHHPAQRVGNEAQQAKFTHTLHHNKESSEEEKRVPFNGMQSLVAVMHVEGNQQPDGPHDRDPGRVKMSDRMQEEGADDTTQDNSTLDEERSVCDWVHLLQFGDVDGEVTFHSILEVIDEVVECKGAAQDNARTQVEQESVEIQVLGQQVADDDVWRVTNHGRRPTNVGEDRLTDEIGPWINVHQLAELAGHRSNKKNRGNVVQESGEDGCHNAKEEEEFGLVSTRHLASKNSRPLEHTRSHRNADDEHHTPEKTKSAMVHPTNDFGERWDTILHCKCDHAKSCANHSSHSSVKNLSHDKSEKNNHNECGNPDLDASRRPERVHVDCHGHGVFHVRNHDEVLIQWVVL